MSNVPPPLPSSQRPSSRTPEFKAVLSVLLCGVLATLLNSNRLVEVAERKEFGADRDRWVNAALVVDEAASELHLDLPAKIADALIDADAPETDVRFGELAVLGLAFEPPPNLEDQEPNITEPSSNPPADPDPPSSPVEPPVPNEAPPLRTLTPDDPLRIWVGGDSLGQFIGGHLKNDYVDRELSTVFDDYNIATGLARPDYFDWPARLTREMSLAESRPEALVLMLGGNDDQRMRRPDGVIVEPLTLGWEAEYRERVETVMDVAGYPDSRLFWINLPQMRDETRNEISASINEIVFDAAATRPWVHVINIIPLFTGPEGSYVDQLADENGTLRKTRAPDGVHLTAIASDWIAELVWEAVATEWKLS